METNTMQQATKPEAPSGVKILSLLMIISGAIALFGTFLFGSLGAPVFGVIMAIGGIVTIVTAIGIRKMKRWGLYLYTLLVVAGIVMLMFDSFTFDNIVSILIPALIAIYLWSLHKQFN